MRLHNVLEDIRAHLTDTSLLGFIGRTYSSYVQFDFGNLDSISDREREEFVKYALELNTEGALRLPYDSVAFSGITQLGMNDGVGNLLILAENTTDNSSIHFIVFAKFLSDRMTSIFTTIHLDKMKGLRKTVLRTPINLFTEEPVEGDVIVEYLRRVVNEFLVMLVILNANGVEQRTIEAPVKLNKARVKRGKLPIQPLREIVIRVGDRVLRPSGEDANRSHASPRCHWRRGHVRRLANGNLTHVRPCLVGQIGSETPARRDYKVVA